MKKIRITQRGKKLIFSTFILALASIIFRDFIILALFVAALILLLISYIDVFQFGMTRIKLSPANKFYRAVSGQHLSLSFLADLENKRIKNCVFTLPQLREMSLLTSQNNIIIFEGSIQKAGIINLNEVHINYISKLGIFSINLSCVIENVQIIVYPRFVIPLSRLIEYEIAEIEYGNTENYNFFKIGTVGDYIGTRDYLPGDELRHIDWKATARLQALKVKEFSVPNLTSVCLLFDTTCSDPFSADKLASEFFSTLLDYADTGVVLTVYLYDGSSFVSLKARDLIKELTEASLKMIGKFEPDLPRVLDLPIARISFEEKYEYSKKHLQPFGHVVAITQLLSDMIDQLLSIAVTSEGNSMVENKVLVDAIIQPTTPWLERYFGLEDAYIIMKEIDTKKRHLRRNNISVLSSQSEL